jgi:hypothetical protein
MELAHSVPAAGARPRPEEGVFALPGGFVDGAGAVHREVALRPLTGREEEYLASLAEDTPSGGVITQLLARCVRRIGDIPGVDAAAIRDMLVGDREYLMVKLRQMTSGDRLRILLPCPSSDCGKQMEIPLSLAELPVEERPVTARSFTAELRGRGSVEFRLPTGGDQEALAGAAEPDGVAELLRRCVLRIPAEATLEEAGSLVESRIEELAPRVELEIDAACPECGREFTAPLDLAGFVMSELMADLRNLEQEVHILAWHYHWPESEILAMTRKKRRRYIELVEDELERMNPS